MKIRHLLFSTLLLAGNGIVAQTTDKMPQAIVFLSAKCPCVYSHKDSFKSLVNKYGTKIDFLIVFVGKNEDSEDIDDMLKNLNWGIKYVTDKKDWYVKEYAPKVFTDVVLIDTLGQVIYKGSIDDGALNSGQILTFYLRDAIEDFLNKRPVKVKTGKGVGCLIIM